MTSDEEEARALYAEAWDHHMDGRRDLARVSYLRAARIADAAGALDVRADALAGVVRIDCATQRYKEALSRADEAIALCKALGRAATLASLLECRASSLTQTQQWLDARIAWRQAKEAMSAAGWRGWQVDLCDSRIAEATKHIQKAVRAERRAAGPDVSRRPLFGRHWVR